MRFAALFLFCALCASAQDDQKQVVSVVNKLFDGMAANDARTIASTMTPDARIVAAQDDRISSRTGEEFAQRFATNKNQGLERIWDPTVLIRGRIAIVWAEYDYHLAGKFNHCGIDAFTLLKTDAGWRISGIQYTTETQGCKPSPLGPPKP
ncbi:MAG TPA: nuclear transport factor 2 family protein [Bryobacteraceae bacterium]|nr:nuclear transport factor 2 family protein [Bryobacteraceae bacterium]